MKEYSDELYNYAMALQEDKGSEQEEDDQGEEGDIYSLLEMETCRL